MKEERLMLDPKTADVLRATVIELRSLDGSKVVSFLTFSLTEDRCVRLLVKTLGKQVPESVVGVNWRLWAFMFKDSCSSVPGAAIRMKSETNQTQPKS
jgi:hypothetical protein